MTIRTLLAEPRGAVYRALLEHALGSCTSGLLVVRDDLGLDPTGQQCLEALAPFVLSSEARSSWPGTVLLGHTARVISFRFDRASLEVLAAHSAALFDWTQPTLPEDLCLLRQSGEPWLVTIAHERDAYLVATDTELATLRSSAPEIRVAEPGTHPG